MDRRQTESMALFLEELARRLRAGTLLPRYLSIDLRHVDVPHGFFVEAVDTGGRRLTFDYFVPPHEDAPMPMPPGMVVLPAPSPLPTLKG